MNVITEKIGTVSVWLGNVDSKKSLEEYVGKKYYDEKELVHSKFIDNFNINPLEYDEDFEESTYYRIPQKSLRELLKGSSYSEEIIPKFIEKYGENLPESFNSIIRIYNLEYEGFINKVNNDGNKFEYIGSVEYEEWYE